MHLESFALPAERFLKDGARRRKIFLLLVVLAAVLPYLNSLGGDFVWDDPLLIRDNRYIKEWRYLPRLFTESMGAGSGYGRGDVYSFWRPLPMLSLAGDWALFGLEPFGYHLTNLLIHALGAAAVFWLAGLLAADSLAALLAALLWAVHPIQTEAVAYVSGRDTALGTLLVLVSVASWVRYRTGAGRFWYRAGLAAFALALMSKESAVALPMLLLAWEAIFPRAPAQRWRSLAPFFALDLAWVAAKLTVLSFDFASVPGRSLALGHRLSAFFASLPAYARLLVLPGNQHVDYGFVRLSPGEPVVLAGLAIFAGLVVASVTLRRRHPAVSFALAWIVLNLVIYSGLYPTNAWMAEHWLSNPSVGFFMLAAAGATWAARRAPALGAAVPAAAVLVLVVLGAMTVRQNRYWNDPVVFYARSISLAPPERRPEWYYNLGNYHLWRNDFPRAAEAYREALRLAPGFDLPALNLGVIYERQGLLEEAARALGQALLANPRNCLAWRNLGVLDLRRGERARALEDLREARRLGCSDRDMDGTIGALERSLAGEPSARP